MIDFVNVPNFRLSMLKFESEQIFPFVSCSQKGVWQRTEADTLFSFETKEQFTSEERSDIQNLIKK